MKVRSTEGAELANVLSVKPGVCRNIALHATPAVGNPVILSSAFPAYSASHKPDPLPV